MHGPHHIFKEWADKYKSKFDGGWDAYRERVFARQKAMGWIPPDTKLTPRPDTLPAWNSLSAEEKKFQARLMEVYAGFLEYTDTEAGRIIDELEKEGIRDNTLIFYVFSDNGASAEGLQGTISELLAQNGIPTTFEQQMNALNELGGLDALGLPRPTTCTTLPGLGLARHPSKVRNWLLAILEGPARPSQCRGPNKSKPTRRPMLSSIT